jgi:hypothetical protein
MYNDVSVCIIHNSNKSNCLRKREEDGSNTGSLLAELNDLLRPELSRGTAKADFVSPLSRGDF